MIRLSRISTRSGAALATLGAASLVAACGSSAHHAASANGTPASAHTQEVSLTSGRLTGANGHVLYLWDRDRHDKSNCHGSCAAAWPPLVAKSKPRAGHGVNAGDLSMISRGGGQRQVAYDGHPLYYYAGDSRGTTRGQGSNAFGARWWLVSAAGKAITHSSGKSKGSGYGSGSGSGSGW